MSRDVVELSSHGDGCACTRCAGFGPGNEVAKRHGAYSERNLAPVAAALIEEVTSDPAVSYLQDAAYRPALVNWARAQARVEVFSEWLERNRSSLTSKRAMDADERLRQWLTTALRHADGLGLTPLARARFGRDLSTAQAMARSGLSQWMQAGSELARRDGAIGDALDEGSGHDDGDA